MADDVPNDNRVIDALLDLHSRGFHSEEFRESAARAVEKIANRKPDISDEVIGILVDWLRLTPAAPEMEGEIADIEVTSRSKDENLEEGSIIWGYGNVSLLPGGNFNILSTLASILLNRKESGRDRYFAILEEHLSREHDSDVWRALLCRLGNAGGSTPQIVSNFLQKLFDCLPAILTTREAVTFLAYAQRWDEEFVLEPIIDWRKSGRRFLQQGYGELVGLVAILKEKDNWARALDEIVASGTDDMKIGLAHAAVNLWPDQNLRLNANKTLVALLKGASKDLVGVVMDVFRVSDELAPDGSTMELLRALSDPDTDMSAAPSHFVVERLQGLLPHEPELIALVAEKLVAAWRGELGDMRTGTATVAPQLTDLALTLHRLGGASRQSGVALFEAMIEIDAYGARETLAEIDGRFGPQQLEVGRRLARRRTPRGQRRRAA
jgi:hypothetical protein